MTLAELAAEHGTDKFEHGYCPHYETHLAYLRDTAFTLLEIGVHKGGSLRMWRDYFPHASIVGVDINPGSMLEGEDRITTVLGDATNLDTLDLLPDGVPMVVVDDGSHMVDDILTVFHRLWWRLPAGGWYIIEDLGAQFCREFGGHISGSRATRMLEAKLREAFRGAVELHAYQELVLLRKVDA